MKEGREGGEERRGGERGRKYSALLLHVDIDPKDGILNFNVQEETGIVVLLKALSYN